MSAKKTWEWTKKFVPKRGPFPAVHVCEGKGKGKGEERGGEREGEGAGKEGELVRQDIEEHKGERG